RRREPEPVSSARTVPAQREREAGGKHGDQRRLPHVIDHSGQHSKSLPPNPLGDGHWCFPEFCRKDHYKYLYGSKVVRAGGDAAAEIGLYSTPGKAPCVDTTTQTRALERRSESG